jgi:hypothetical protein
MSRAYRVKVRESLRQVIRAEDRVSTQLEWLEILPADSMAGLLRGELAARGFQAEGGRMVRRRGGVTVAVAPESGTVTVSAESSDEVTLEVTREGVSYDDFGPSHKKQTEERLRDGIRKDLEQKAGQAEAALQAGVTDRLERELIDLRPELDQVVNRVTAEALKRKAAQMGQIKEMTEDPRDGSLTIVLEV